MQRFTISLDDRLAEQFDSLIARRGYENRSEAVRDLIRLHLNDAPEGESADAGEWCVANVSYVYDHHDQPAAGRVRALQHGHHDLVMSSMHIHLDHANCLEAVVLRGRSAEVRALAGKLVSQRGVRHGNVHLVALDAHARHHHAGHGEEHVHYTPRS